MASGKRYWTYFKQGSVTEIRLAEITDEDLAQFHVHRAWFYLALADFLPCTDVQIMRHRA